MPCVSGEADTRYFNFYQENEVNINDFRDLIERSGFSFENGEFENLIKWYFRGKEQITMEEFKLFATGNCVKMTDAKKK